ncbi:DegT/DnrJ/EryC1/StrS family aminotransferase, partial [Chloroflexota bacterium]
GQYMSEFLGFNFRMSELPAAIGIVQLKHLEDWIERRREIARQYQEWLPEEVIKPRECPGRRHVYQLYVVRTLRRDELMRRLREDEIETGIHYPVPIHRQPVFSQASHLPKTERLCQEILSLPMHPSLRSEQIQYICQKISNSLSPNREV